MLNIKIIGVGKLKEKYLVEAVNEYKKRLSGYCNLEIIELEPVRISDKPSEKQIEAALLKEAEDIIKRIPQNSAVYPFCVEGKGLSSPAFANEISACANEGKSIVFIIGSSYGLSEKIKALGKRNLSVSEMTFAHQLFRVMVLEQIYRAFKINECSAYHK